MASLAVSNNPVTNTDRSFSRRKKKKKLVPNPNPTRDQALVSADASAQWNSDAQQQVYSSKLLQALRQVRSTTTTSSPKRGRAVREAADRVLAVTAKGRTRWSRAILTNRVKLKFMKKSSGNINGNKTMRRRVTMLTTTRGNSRWQRKPKVSILRLKAKSFPAFQRKARVLGGLIPGCKKQSLPVILEEATDYVPALVMQVRAMTALTELLYGARARAGAAASSPSSSSQVGPSSS